MGLDFLGYVRSSLCQVFASIPSECRDVEVDLGIGVKGFFNMGLDFLGYVRSSLCQVFASIPSEYRDVGSI